MFRLNKKFRFVIVTSSIIFFTLLFFGITIVINRKNIYPTELERRELNIFFNNRKIKTIEDVIYIQNYTIEKIRHQFVSSKQLNSISTLKIKKGFCFDRSLVLQKYCLINGYKIRPVYLFWGTNDTNIFDFLKKHINSHNVFEIYIDNKWYLVRTNHQCNKLESLESYLKSGKSVPTHTRYIKYLNNRNGDFIYPSYLPDIYFF